MKKNQGLLLGIYAIILVVYNIVTFILAGEKTATFWTAYLFTMLSYALMVGVYFICRGKNSSGAFLGIPVAIFSAVYVTVQLLVSIVLMVIPYMSIKATVIIEVVLLAVYLVIAMSALMAKNTVQGIDTKQKQKTFYIRNLADNLQTCAQNCADETAKAKILALKEAVQYSDPMSDSALQPLEEQLQAKAAGLYEHARTGDADAVLLYCRQMTDLLDQRNRRCKLLK